VPSPHQQPQQPYQQRHAHYQGRHHYNPSNKHAGVNHSPNMQHSQPFVPHHQKKSMSPHIQSAPSPSMSAAQNIPMGQQWSNQIPNQFVSFFHVIWQFNCLGTLFAKTLVSSS
jgi:hypothetical protein